MDYFSKERERKEKELAHTLSMYESALDLAETEDYKSAYEAMKIALEPLDAETQYNWGVCYFNGIGVIQDFKKAFIWFQKAAEKNYLSAERALGLLCLINDHELYNPTLGLKYAEEAAQAGNAECATLLGVLYLNGDEVPQNAEIAKYWLEKAARSGDKRSKFALGYELFRGEKLPQSFEQAWRWLSEFDREIEKDDEEKDYYGANCLLGIIYLLGKGADQNYQKAEKCLSLAAKHGDEEAQYWLAVMCFLGLGIKKDTERGNYWLQESIKNGSEDAKKLAAHQDDREEYLSDVVWK